MPVSFRLVKVRKEFVMGQMKEGQIGELNLPCSKDLCVQDNVRCLARGITTVIEDHQKSLCEHSLGMCSWNKWFHFEMTCHLDAAEETVWYLWESTACPQTIFTGQSPKPGSLFYIMYWRWPGTLELPETFKLFITLCAPKKPGPLTTVETYTVYFLAIFSLPYWWVTTTWGYLIFYFYAVFKCLHKKTWNIQTVN